MQLLSFANQIWNWLAKYLYMIYIMKYVNQTLQEKIANQ